MSDSAILEKRCPRCETVKTLDAFTIRKTGRVGHPVAHCKSCRTASVKLEYDTDHSVYRRVHWPSKLKRLYGMTVDDYFEMLDEQNGGCATCGVKTPSGRHYKRMGKQEMFYVDHCHSTGRVRGLLCLTCNTAIGLIRDSPQIAENIGAYLRKGV